MDEYQFVRPTVIAPQNIIESTTDSNGKIITFTPTAIAGSVPIDSGYPICSKLNSSGGVTGTNDSGTMFPVGDTTVSCYAYDVGGSSSDRMEFTVTVILEDTSNVQASADTTSCSNGCNLSDYQTNTDISNPNFMQPAIAMSGNDITVVWQINVGVPDPVYFAKSHDGGLTFSAPEYLNHFPTGHHPDELWSWFNDSGNNTEGLAFINYSYPSMGNSNNITLQSGGNSYKVWHVNVCNPDGISANICTPDNYEVFLSKNNSTPINLSNNTTGSVGAVVAVDGSNVYVAWKDYSSGDTKAYVARSTDGGVSFEQPILVDSKSNAGFRYGKFYEYLNCSIKWKCLCCMAKQ